MPLSSNRLQNIYIGIRLTNGASAAYSYDTASRLLYIDNQTGNGQHKYSYMYDNVGNRGLECRVYAGRTGLSRLKAELRTGIAAA